MYANKIVLAVFHAKKVTHQNQAFPIINVNQIIIHVALISIHEETDIQ